MKIQIYQVNTERDPNDVCFMGYDRLEKLQGTTAIDSAIYDKVFSGEVKCKNLEDVWVKFNKAHPKGYKARSLSKSDIVEVIGNNGASEFHYVILSASNRSSLNLKKHSSARNFAMEIGKQIPFPCFSFNRENIRKPLKLKIPLKQCRSLWVAILRNICPLMMRLQSSVTRKEK